MGKPTICIGENKGADQLRAYRKADHAFVFATWIVQRLLYLFAKFQASSLLLLLYSLVCVRPVWKPHCWFFHEVAHLFVCVLTIEVPINDFSVKSKRDIISWAHNIRKICPCKVYPLKTHFYLVKLRYAGLYLFFLFLL